MTKNKAITVKSPAGVEEDFYIVEKQKDYICFGWMLNWDKEEANMYKAKPDHTGQWNMYECWHFVGENGTIVYANGDPETYIKNYIKPWILKALGLEVCNV